jgi:hypothetical protein
LGGPDHFHTATLPVHCFEQGCLQHQPSFPLEALKDLAFHLQVKQSLVAMPQQKVSESHLASCAPLEMQIFVQDFVEHLSSSVE